MVGALPTTSKRVIELDVSCITCRYNLRGLDPDSQCPECGGAIVPSLIAYKQRTLRRPEPLKSSGRYWLTQQIEGTWFLLMSLTLLMCLELAPYSLYEWRSRSRVVMLALSVSRIVFDWYGVWKIATRRPDDVAPLWASKGWFLRGITTFAMLLPLVLMGLPSFHIPEGLILPFVLAMFTTVGGSTVLLFVHVRSTALRADRPIASSLSTILAQLMAVSAMTTLLPSGHGMENSLSLCLAMPSSAWGNTEVFKSISAAAFGRLDFPFVMFLLLPAAALFVLIRTMVPLYRARREAIALQGSPGKTVASSRP